MRIINLTDFLNLPEGILYTPWESSIHGELRIKGQSIPEARDFYFQSIVETFEDGHGRLAVGDILTLDLDCLQRDGLFDNTQLFAIWSKEEVQQLINKLTATLTRAC